MLAFCEIQCAPLSPVLLAVCQIRNTTVLPVLLCVELCMPNFLQSCLLSVKFIMPHFLQFAYSFTFIMREFLQSCSLSDWVCLISSSCTCCLQIQYALDSPLLLSVKFSMPQFLQSCLLSDIQCTSEYASNEGVMVSMTVMEFIYKVGAPIRWIFFLPVIRWWLKEDACYKFNMNFWNLCVVVANWYSLHYYHFGFIRGGDSG
jgi:hypothetical protein